MDQYEIYRWMMLPKYSGNIKIPYGTREARVLILSVLKDMRAKVQEDDRDSNKIHARTKVSWRSWGEDLYIEYYGMSNVRGELIWRLRIY